MQLNVKCFATLAGKSPPGGVCELPEGADVSRPCCTTATAWACSRPWAGASRRETTKNRLFR